MTVGGSPSWVKGKIAAMGQGELQTSCGGRLQYAYNPGVTLGASGWKDNSDINKLCQEGRLKEALHIVELKVQHGIRVSINTISCLLQGCIRMKALTESKRVHFLIIKNGFESNIFFGNSLVNLYANCGSLLDARKVFDRMSKCNVFSWTAIISAYAKQGLCEEALDLFQQMQPAGVVPDKVLFVIVLKACARLAALERGREVHSQIMKIGIGSNTFLETALVDMYGKCGSVKDARQVFDKMRKRDVVSWNAMIGVYVEQRHGKEALILYEQMQQEGIKPDDVTFVSILRACASLENLERGKQIHSQVIKSGLELNVVLENTLIDMYGKCGSMEDACHVFHKMRERTVVSWNVMISGYVQQGHGKEALTLFEEMQWEGMKPDKVTFISILKACALLAALERGKQVHAQIIGSGLEFVVSVQSSLIDMYGKCGSIEIACEVFNKMDRRDVISWTAMIGGYVQHGYGEEALMLFERMQREGIEPDMATFVCILKACANMGALERGKQVHAQIIKSGLEWNFIVQNSLVDMYGKCGNIKDARQVFNKMHERDIFSWNVMIAGYSQQGHVKEVLTLFKQMQQEGMKPDMVTFVSVLSACSHAGLVDEGFCLFDSLSEDHGITPTLEHYCCMVDLLGRAGRLYEAQDFIYKMPVQPNAVVWMALLGACRNHCDVELGVHAFEHVIKLEPNCGAAYVLLSNIFATAGQWDQVAKIRKELKIIGVKKQPGCSSIEVNGKVHTFLEGDRTHSQIKKILAELKRLNELAKKLVYMPNMSFVLHDMGDKEKKGALYDHSEKLAIGFGLISLPPRTPIRIQKNLRVCVDCHNTTKIISKIVGREIIARDANRFHHFKDGVCSCGDYW